MKARIDEPIVWTVPEVARLLGIDRGLVYEMCRRGQIPYVRAGRFMLIPKARFDEWLAGTWLAVA